MKIIIQKNNPIIMFRKIMFLLSIALMASCTKHSSTIETAGSNKSLSTKQATTELNFVGHWLYQAKREDLVRELAKEYEFLNQNCKVNLKFPEDIYYTRTKVDCEEEFVASQLLSATSQYDIIRINDAYLRIAFYMKDMEWPKKYLVDFSQFSEFKDNTIPELVNEEAKQKWQGIIPGPYLEGYNYALWFNSSLAKEIGINVKQFDMTFEDLLGYVKAIDSYNKAHKTNIIPIHECSDWNTINVLAYRLFISEYGETINNVIKDYYDEKKLQAFYKTLKAFEELSKYNAFSRNWKNYEFQSTLHYPLKKKAFFYINASWMYNYWQKEDSSNTELSKMVPAELPVFKPSDIYFGGYSIMWAVPKNAPHKEEAIKFLLYMTNPDIAEKWNRYTKCPTGLKGNVTSVSFGTDAFEDFTFTINKKYGMNKLSFNYLDNNLVLGVSKTNVKLRAIDVATGLMTADEAMADIRKNLR